MRTGRSGGVGGLTKSVGDALAALERSLERARKAMDDAAPRLDIASRKSPEDDLALAVALNGAWIVMMRARGEDVNDSPVLADYERSLRAFERIIGRHAKDEGADEVQTRGEGEVEDETKAAASPRGARRKRARDDAGDDEPDERRDEKSKNQGAQSPKKWSAASTSLAMARNPPATAKRSTNTSTSEKKRGVRTTRKGEKS